MAEDVLSQAELETLLSALDSGPPPACDRSPTSRGPQARPFAASAPAAVPRQKVQAPDFKRPERFDPARMRTLQTLHEGFARTFAAALSTMLRSVVRVKLTAIDDLAYGEFLFRLETPTYFNVLRADPLEGNLILDIQPSILYPIIDRMLGGGREPAAVARRPLTDIELRLASRITGLMLEELRKAWHHVADLDLAVERVESNPQRAQIVPPQDAVVRIRFELAIHETRGVMTLGIPCLVLRSINGKLAGSDWTGNGRRPRGDETFVRMGDGLPSSPVELVAYLAETKIAESDMLDLRVGDIITTEQDVHSPISVSLDGVPKFSAQPGAHEGHKAIEIVTGE
jgi:flagellar motor switch protein FliM